MLRDTPWKADAVLRLFLSVFVCIFGGSVLSALLLQSGKPGHPDWVLLGFAAAALLFFLGTLYLLSQPWQVERLGRQLTYLLVLFYGGLICGASVQRFSSQPGASVAQMIVTALSFQGASLLLVARLLRNHGKSWAEAFGLDNNVLRAVLSGLAVACIFLPVGWFLQQLSGFMLTHVPHLGLKPEEQQAVQTLRMAVSGADRLALGLITILLAPVGEELLFRGVLYPWIKQMGFPRAALWGTSLLFAAVHVNLVTFLPLLALALTLTWLYERAGNLLAPIATHGVFNALNFGMFYLLPSH